MLAKRVLARLLILPLCAQAVYQVDSQKLEREAVDPVQVLVDHGMQRTDAEETFRDLTRAQGSLAIFKVVRRLKREGQDPVPGLMELLGRGSLTWKVGTSNNELRSDLSRRITSRDIYWWLCVFKDIRAEADILQYFHAQAPHRIRHRDDVRDLKLLILPLGWQATPKALDLLFRMLERDYWMKDFDLSIDSEGDAPKPAVIFRELQEQALTALAESGHERVVHALGTGDGIPEELADSIDSAFEAAVRSELGIIGYPELRGHELPPETHSKIEGIYRKYGKTYIPRDVLTGIGHPSPN